MINEIINKRDLFSIKILVCDKSDIIIKGSVVEDFKYNDAMYIFGLLNLLFCDEIDKLKEETK